MTLYHYTCDHGHEHIFAQLLPASWQTQREVPGPGQFVWLTDLASPNRDALGLTSHILRCDRTVHRYRVTDASGVVPWTDVRGEYPWAQELESAPDARPRHWFVSPRAVPVVYDPIVRAAA